MLYENMTFENIMDRCLSRVAASIDKREGSVVYDAIAPAAAELAIMYIELAYLLDRAFPDTEEGDDLTLKCQERSVFRTPATAAVRKGYFEDGDGGAMDVPIGSRYSGDALNYVVTEKIATGQFKLLCETAGAAGDGIEERALAGTVGADDGGKLPVGQLERKVGQGTLLVHGAGVERLGNVGNFKHRSRPPFRTGRAACGRWT